MIPSSSDQLEQEISNKLLVVPLRGLIEHDPLEGG